MNMKILRKSNTEPLIMNQYLQMFCQVTLLSVVFYRRTVAKDQLADRAFAGLWLLQQWLRSAVVIMSMEHLDGAAGEQLREGSGQDISEDSSELRVGWQSGIFVSFDEFGHAFHQTDHRESTGQLQLLYFRLLHLLVFSLRNVLRCR